MNIEICFREEVDSTNRYAKQMAEEGAPEGTLALADAQTAGRGRFDRNWASPRGEAIYMSLILRPDIRMESASQLTLVMGLSVAEAIRDTLHLPAQIKWPNDVVIDGKKICGVLTEMSVDAGKIRYVVIGVGINVNNRHFPDALRATATSLYLENGKEEDRRRILQEVLSVFERNYQMFLKREDMRDLLERYQQLLVNRDREVKVMDGRGVIEGTARGINEQGELLVEQKDGKILQIYAGEVSVRGLYGYT